MGWPATLQLDYRCDTLIGAPRTVVHDRHEGPLRILASLYPESPVVCHNVLVHPPGGIVGGDTIAITARLAPHCHALVTTPGATRFYRSAGVAATQALDARLADGARLEWLPLETIAHSGCSAENRMRFELAAGAEMIGWDLLALGLPASNEPFERGRCTQQIELPACGWSAARSTRATSACSTRRSAGPGSACWPRCGSRRVRRCPMRDARRCSTARGHRL